MELSDNNDKLISNEDEESVGAEPEEEFGNAEPEEEYDGVEPEEEFGDDEPEEEYDITEETDSDKKPGKVKQFFSKLIKKRKKIFALLILFILVFAIAVELISVPVLYSLALDAGPSKYFKKPEPSQQSIEWMKDLYKDEYTEAFDGIKLHALYIKNKNISGSYIIICHPYGASAEYMAHYAEHYYDLGFNIFLADARGHGKSEGEFIGMGWLDRLDIMSWVDYIDKKDENARIVIHGLGMGGFAALAASGEKLPDSVRVIINDSGYSSVTELFKYQIKERIHLPSFPLLKLESLYTEKRAGWSFDEADALAQVKKSTTPTLFIHGGCDMTVPLKQGNLLYDACAAKKKQIIMTSADFGLCEQNSPEKYWGEIDRFLLNNLGQIIEVHDN